DRDHRQGDHLHRHHHGGEHDLLVVLRSEVPGGDGSPPGAAHAVQHLRRAGHRAGLDEDHPPPLPPPPPHRGRRARARAAGCRVIEARQLAKRFGGRAAIEDVSLGVAPGEVVGFLGPNGAGKTTTLRILAGVFPPTSGQALIDGHDVVRAPLAARRRLGYAPERPALHLEMTVAGLCDRVVILHRGRVLSAGTPARLAARLRPASRIDVEAAAPADALAAALAAVPGVRRVDLVTQTNGHARCRVEVEPGRDARAQLAARVTGSGWGLLALAPVETSLEEAFLALVASEEGTSK